MSSCSHEADADSPLEYRGSPSSESESSDSPDDGSDGGLDSATHEYMPEACPTTAHDNTHYQQQKLDDRRRLGLTPNTYLRCQDTFEHNPFHRGKSAPPSFSTAAPSASEFAPPNIPSIVVTEPQQVATWGTTTTQFFEDPAPYQQQEAEEASESWPIMQPQRGGAQGHTGFFYTDGFGTVPGFSYQMSM